MSGTIAERLRGRRRVYLDTAAIVYFIEQHPDYYAIVRPMFELVDSGEVEGLSSYITLVEVLVKPLQLGRMDLARKYKSALVEGRNMSLFPVDQEVAETGADIRARYSFRTPDAIQLATAVQERADLFVTNDVKLKRFEEVEILVLDDLIEHGKKKEP